MRPLLLLALSVLVGCTTARDRAVDRASRAAARGDLVEAALAWSEACRLEPEDCPRAEAARDAAIADAVEAATPACEAGDTLRCVDALAAARRLAPEDPRLVSLLADAGRLQLSTCGDARDLAGLRCAERHRDALAEPGYDALLAERRARLADALAAQVSGDPGADAMRLGAAACLDGTAARRRAAADAAQRFDESIALPIALTWEVPGVAPPFDCAELADGRPLRCGDGGLVVEVQGAVEATQHERFASSEPVAWTAGTRALPNPAYGPAATRVVLAEDALRAIAAERALAESKCRAAERALSAAGYCLDCPARRHADRACEQARALEDLEDDREAELREARWDLDRTPAFLKEPIHHTAQLQQTDHTWSARWRATVRVGDRIREVSGVAVHRDREHAGLQAAGLDPDPLQPPPPDLGAAELAAAAHEAAVASIDAALRDVARERARACPESSDRDDDDWLRCRGEVLRFSGQPADGAELLAARAGGAIACR